MGGDRDAVPAPPYGTWEDRMNGVQELDPKAHRAKVLELTGFSEERLTEIEKTSAFQERMQAWKDAEAPFLGEVEP